MKRRESLKYIAASALASATLAAGCKPGEKKEEAAKEAFKPGVHRYEDELQELKALENMPKFFNEHEIATITILGDIIIPKDAVSGSASEAKVPDFIEFTVKDQPKFQVPMRGGLKWLDMFCLKKFNKSFKDCSEQQRIEVVDLIAYPERAKGKSELTQGVAFFSTIRDLTATGFYTSEMGVKDLGYAGNKPNQWNGVPDDVLKQYGMAYTPRELEVCLSFDA
ncbi:gluconate 2-dehydrogenase subunit 3 family protein [Niabella ginsengisoli]|uniref:Gluconate 2-dehydrogenase subunit 3 family protein n=1 Tax=Niabella ginsengisoli TaxID=522298 RepID=A0ABS9SK51_9BACT|nr:gluconate 2-dehydrogenase subunit 3 family protein [Niabella ginsengisoli]MCH5598690.1 gluconate 2-dehydrogenase subunit 3 family protein [Niabella ginsengisoli]